jgi:hypothetical protein
MQSPDNPIQSRDIALVASTLQRPAAPIAKPAMSPVDGPSLSTDSVVVPIDPPGGGVVIGGVVMPPGGGVVISNMVVVSGGGNLRGGGLSVGEAKMM